MESRAKLFGHAVHPMLIAFPLGLLTTAVVFDLIYLATGRTGFTVAAAYTIAAGILGGLAAGLFGLIDYLAIPRGTRARRVGLWHGIGNAVVLGLFGVSWLLRLDGVEWAPSGIAMAFSFAGLAVSGLTAWLGGELVERLGVSVTEGAGLDAPNSLSRRSAGPRAGRHVRGGAARTP